MGVSPSSKEGITSKYLLEAVTVTKMAKGESSMTNVISFEDRIAGLRSGYFPPSYTPCIGDISVERARLVTEAYKANDGLPIEIKRAKGLEATLNNISIYISDNDLIVGNVVSRPRSVEVFPDIACDWIIEEIDTLSTREADKWEISDADKGELLEICKWWQGKTMEDRVRFLVGEEEFGLLNKVVFQSTTGQSTGHNMIIPDYASFFKKGFNGIIADVEEKLKECDPTDGNNLDKITFYKAVLIVAKAAIQYGHRYAELAREKAKNETNAWRKAELLQIAETCDHIPGNPVRNFRDALQMVTFVHTVQCLDSAALANGIGKFDSYMYSYYKKDIENGTLTKAEAQELLECFLLHFNDSKLFWPALCALYSAALYGTHVLTLGGVNEQGLDASNELSFLVLDCYKHLKMAQPELTVHMHKDTPDEFLKSVCELLRMGTGHPKIGMVETLEKMKASEPQPFTPVDLRNLAWVGCGENCVPGKDRGGPDWTWSTGGCIALEMALNNGVNRTYGEKWGVETGDASKFNSFEEVMDAWEKQTASMLRHVVIWRSATLRAHQQLLPAPYRSIFVYDCIGRGKDILSGGALYKGQSGATIGTTTTADALAGIKKVVFDDKKCTMKELLDALATNWEGKEALRQLFVNAPKFGNDDDYVDLIARRVSSFQDNTLRSFTNEFSGVFRNTYVHPTSGIPVGRMVGATPDGRFAGEPLNEGGISPHQGRDVKGPTAVIKSVSKIDWTTNAGGILNMKFSPSAVAGEEGLQGLMTLLKAYNRLGGYHVQFNVINLETLMDARKHPEKYQNLIVRVGSYCSYFTHLSEVMQDNIIERTQHELVL